MSLQVTQWASVKIDGVPPGWRPLLVFLNTKSGPQTGSRMRRRFLRCLNPLQVTPGASLACECVGPHLAGAVDTLPASVCLCAEACIAAWISTLVPCNSAA